MKVLIGKSCGSWLLCSFLLFAACGSGRTPLLPPACELRWEPSAIDFGDVPPGQTVVRYVRVSNVGGAECRLWNVGLAPDSDAWFGVSAAMPSSLVLEPGSAVELSVIFRPGQPSVPLVRTGQLAMDVDSPATGYIAVPVTGEVQSKCVLEVSPAAIDFGHVRIGSTATDGVRLANQGTGPCEIDRVGLVPGTDAQFFLPDAWSGPVRIAPWEEQVVGVGFAASDASKPHRRTGHLGFASTDPQRMSVTVPLAADIDIGCDLTWTPARLDFGNVILNNQVSANLTLENDGSDACAVSGLALTPDSHADFALSSGQALSFSVAPGAKEVIAVTFTAADSAPPHLKTGTLTFDTGNAREPAAQVPLSALVSTVCVEASRWIYTVDNTGHFARFDPTTRRFTDIALLDCPSSRRPFSMAVDQNAVAWILFDDGNLFKVDTGSGACAKSGFESGQHGFKEFGMGFVFDPATGTDTLYIAGGPSIGTGQSTLATVSFPSLEVTPIGQVTAGDAELTGTGDGELWGFVPRSSSSTGQAVLVRLDPHSGAILELHEYPTMTGTQQWAVKFWGGDFWIFLEKTVYRVSRGAPDVAVKAIANTGRDPIVGAGVSTCAPLH